MAPEPPLIGIPLRVGRLFLAYIAQDRSAFDMLVSTMTRGDVRFLVRQLRLLADALEIEHAHRDD